MSAMRASAANMHVIASPSSRNGGASMSTAAIIAMARKDLTQCSIRRANAPRTPPVPRRRLALAQKRAILDLPTRRRVVMAKGQMRSNKEKRKPKKDKGDKKGAAAKK